MNEKWHTAVLRANGTVRSSLGFAGARDIVCQSADDRRAAFMALLDAPEIEHVADWERRTVGGGLEYVSSRRERATTEAT